MNRNLEGELVEPSIEGKEAPDASDDAPGGGETCIEVYGGAECSVPSPSHHLAFGEVFRQVLYILLPCPCLACKRPVPRPSRSPGLCPECLGRLVGPEDDAPWAFEYRPPLDEVIQAMKFRRLDYLADSLADLALPAARRMVDSAGGADAVVPVPLHWRRRWCRGYDQAARLASALARRLELPMWNSLRRVRATPAQSLRDREQRRRNLAGAFALRRSAARRIDGARLLLVDDVITTGSTLDEASNCLRGHGARAVHPFAVAWTPDQDGREVDPVSI